MSAAAERASLAAVAGDLLALRGSAGERRASGLMRTDDAPATDFADLNDAPAWLRWPREAQMRLAHAVALRSIAPELAGSIDGAWLGALASVAGEEAVDWAIAKGADEPRSAGAPIAPDALASHGFAMLRASLPPGLRCNLGWAPHGVHAAADAAALEDALTFVQADAA